MGTKIRYSEAYKLDVLNRAKLVGTIRAAEEFKLPPKTVLRWNDIYHVYKKQKMRYFTDAKKRKMLRYANEHGLTSAMREFNVDIYTFLQWNKKLKIYKPTGRRENSTHDKKYERIDEAKKIEILEYAKIHGISKTLRKYNIPSATFQYWNATRKIYQIRQHRKFSPQTKAEIIEYANETSVSDAAKKFKVTGHQIKKWMSDKEKTE